MKKFAPTLVTLLWVTSCSAGLTIGEDATPTSTLTTVTAASSTSASGASGTAATTETSTSVDSVLVLGDWGSGNEPQGAVAEAMARLAENIEIAAILTTGDNFYGNDAELLMAPFDWVAGRDIDFWLAWGNHDIETPERVAAVGSVFDSPPRWATYSWGEVEVVVLDSNQVANEEQLQFLQAEMNRIEAPTVVVFHHPALSCSLHGDNEAILDSWVPLFDQDVVLVLSGHDHNYQRFEHEGVVYVVTGGGGRRLHDLEDCPDAHPELIEGSAIHHFLVMDQTEDSLAVDVVDVMGDTIDSFEIEIS